MECKSLRDSAQLDQYPDVAFFAASVDDAETNKRFAESLDLNYPILSDPEKTAAKAFGVLNDSGNYARRWTFYIDRDGIVVHVDKEVRPATAGDEVARMIGELKLTDSP